MLTIMAMNELEAKSQAKRTTRYCYVLKCVWAEKEKDSICLERIFTRGRREEEIRLAWWKNGRQTPRPADIDASDWGKLFEKAVKEGVFTDSEKLGMLKALQ
jgi:hypothetical protein